MPLESAPQSPLGRIDPNSLVSTASPVVEPRSTQALVDAYRQGVITADDITQRIGELGQTRKKAEISGLNLQNAQAQAALPNVAPGAALQGQQIESQTALLKYPATAYFDKFAPLLGLQTPTTPDGQVDYPKKEAIGAKLAVWNADRADAHDKLKNIETKDSADGQILFAVTKQGEPVSPEEVARLRAKATKSFSMTDLSPGAVVEPASAAPVAAPKPVIQISPETAAKVRAVLVNEGVPNAAQMTDQQLIAPSVAVVPKSEGVNTTPAVGTIIPGVGTSLGSKAESVRHAPPMTAEQQKGVAQAEFTQAQIKELSSSFSNLSKNEPWLTGPVMGRLSALVHPENWNKSAADFERAKTAILANLAKGIYHETGVLSDKDIERYQKTLPSVKDTPDVAASKLEGTQKDIFSSIATNIETMRAQGQQITPLLSSMEQSAKQALQALQSGAATPAAVTAGSSGVLALPSGRKIQRDANGKYFEVK